MATLVHKTIWLHFPLKFFASKHSAFRSREVKQPSSPVFNLATGTKPPRTTSNTQAGHAQMNSLVQKNWPVRATLIAASAESVTEQANLEDPGDDSSSVASAGDLDEIMEEFSLDDSPKPVQAGPFTTAQLATIQDTFKSSFDQVLPSFPWSLGNDQQPGTFNTQH